MDDIWGSTAGRQAIFGVVMLAIAAMLWFRLEAIYGDGLLAKYMRFVATPACILLGLAALVAAVV